MIDIEITEGMKIQFDADIAPLGSRAINFETNSTRQFLRENPSKIADLALKLLMEAAVQLGTNEKEQCHYVAQACGELKRILTDEF